MADSEQRIKDMVRSALQENPGITNKVLLERAREIDADAVQGLSLRQFHGKFRLPVSRTLTDRASPAGRTPRARARSTRKDEGLPDETKRDAVREIFRRFAVQLSRAEGRSEIVRAAARIDEFVEDVFRTIAGPDGTDTPPPRRTRRTKSTRSRTGLQEPGAGAPPPAPADSQAPGTALVGEPPARDMRRRRRPKSMLKAAPTPEPGPSREEATSPTVPASEKPGQAAGEEANAPERSAAFNLSHDLEEFRRRKYERERGGRRIP